MQQVPAAVLVLAALTAAAVSLHKIAGEDPANADTIADKLSQVTTEELEGESATEKLNTAP